MKAAIFGRILKEKDHAFVVSFLERLSKRNDDIWINKSFAQQISEQLQLESSFQTYETSKGLPSKIDYLFSIGGDGTLLKTATLVEDSDVPVIGINVGRLGFLTSVSKDMSGEILKALDSGDFILDKRTLLCLESNQPIFQESNIALNEVAITKTDSSSMITIETYINDVHLTTYWADGLIIATPTGSTGYSLSCGGPIISPNTSSLVLTAVAPHNLNMRPLVISDDSVLTFRIDGRDEHFLCTLDSRYETIDNSHQLTVKKANYQMTLLRLQNSNFFRTIRDKLNWGVDLRKQ